VGDAKNALKEARIGIDSTSKEEKCGPKGLKEEELPQPINKGASERPNRGGKQSIHVYFPVLIVDLNYFQLVELMLILRRG
jgi:hypothetical protein